MAMADTIAKKDSYPRREFKILYWQISSIRKSNITNSYLKQF